MLFCRLRRADAAELLTLLRWLEWTFFSGAEHVLVYDTAFDPDDILLEDVPSSCGARTRWKAFGRCGYLPGHLLSKG